MKSIFPAAVAFCLLSWTGPTSEAAELYVAFWNVENLFDTEDDPDVAGDEEFTPGGEKHWTAQRFGTKLHNLARVIRDMNGAKGPDILGLAEVENRRVVEALAARLAPLGRDCQIVHRDSPSRRGIDCAILYDGGRVELKASDFLVVHADNTRDIVEAAFQAGGQRLFVFVNHWPSRYHPASARIEAARTLRRRLDELFRADNDADILILGDLNDTPTDDSVQKYLKAGDNRRALRPGALLDTMYPIHLQGDRGTYVYKNQWEVLDHVIVSPGLLDQKRLRWKPGSTNVILRSYQLYYPRDPSRIPRPSRSYTGNYFHPRGYSDHLPVACVLQW